MKKTFLTLLALLSFVVCNAQLKTQTNYDVNGDGTVNITDVTAVVNKVLGKATDEKTMVDKGDITAWVSGIEKILGLRMNFFLPLDQRLKAIEKKLKYNGHEYVDLGLPSGLKWATCNVGASSPEDYGYYFAWGATEPQEVYDLVHAPYQTYNTKNDFVSAQYTKYLGSTTSYLKDPSATDADALKTVLDPEDDAAYINWGGGWRMPTKEEQQELRRNCYWKGVTTYNGKSVNGYIVYKVKDSADKGKDYDNYSPVGSYSVSDPHIFLPAAGYRWESDHNFPRSEGHYWSSSLSKGGPQAVYELYFGSDFVWEFDFSRVGGLSVRPVCP